MTQLDTNEALRELVKASGLTQTEILARFNRGQARPMALRTFKTYLADPESKTRVTCPEAVLNRIRKVIKSA